MNIAQSPIVCLSPVGGEGEVYTGQRHAAGAHAKRPKESGAEAGLYFYNASWRGAVQPRSVPEAERRGFDPEVGRFTCPRSDTLRVLTATRVQADTLIPLPGNPLAWDRYAYANNNPVKYTDPTGHKACEDQGNGTVCVNDRVPPEIINTVEETPLLIRLLQKMIDSIGYGIEEKISSDVTIPLLYGGYYKSGPNSSTLVANNKTSSFILTNNNFSNSENSLLVDVESAYISVTNDSLTIGGRIPSLASPVGIVLPNTTAYYSGEVTIDNLPNAWEYSITGTVNTIDQIATTTTSLQEYTSGFHITHTPMKNTASYATAVAFAAAFYFFPNLSETMLSRCATSGLCP